MIQFPKTDLPPEVDRALARYQTHVSQAASRVKQVELAQTKFAQYNCTDNAVFREIRQTLDSMCDGVRRCMYCEDSGTDELDLHYPKDLFPDRVFVWTNYLYVCGACNSEKNNETRLAERASVLLHPRLENPLDFMMLDIAGETFLFVPTGEQNSPDWQRANYTIGLLRLNTRDYLQKARREAFESYRTHLAEYAGRRDEGVGRGELERRIRALKRMQHPTVWYEMRRQRTLIPEIARLFQQAPEALEW